MKEMSGRKFATIAIISTYCLQVVGSLILTIIGKMSIEVFLATTSGLGTITIYIVKAYFDDKDRNLTAQTEGGQK